MKFATLCFLLFAASLSFGRDKEQKDFPLIIKVLAADQVKTNKPAAPAANTTNVQACAGENMTCINGQNDNDTFVNAQKAAEAWRVADTHNSMLVEINGAQVLLSCTKSGGVLGRHLSSCQILLPGEYHAREGGGGTIEVQDSKGKTIKYEISGTAASQ